MKMKVLVDSAMLKIEKVLVDSSLLKAEKVLVDSSLLKIQKQNLFPRLYNLTQLRV